MNLSTQREMASDVIGCGKNNIWIDPNKQEDVAEAITKADIRRLVQEGAIKEREKDGQSHGRARQRDKQREKGRRGGKGSSKGSNQNDKDEWISKIRAQRKLLKELKNEGKVDKDTYRDLYRKSKGGRFNSKKQLKKYIRREDVLKEGEKIE